MILRSTPISRNTWSDVTAPIVLQLNDGHTVFCFKSADGIRGRDIELHLTFAELCELLSSSGERMRFAGEVMENLLKPEPELPFKEPANVHP